MKPFRLVLISLMLLMPLLAQTSNTESSTKIPQGKDVNSSGPVRHQPITGKPGRKGVRVTLTPSHVEVDAGTYYPFSATVEGTDDQSVSWRVEDSALDARIDAQGVFVASRYGTYRVRAISVVDNTASVVATVDVQSAFHTDTNPLALFRGYSLTLLPNGKVLIAGGTSFLINRDPKTVGFSAKAWIYDPGTKSYTPTGNLQVPRARHQATMLADGRVLIAGGFARWIDPCGIYRPSSLNDFAKPCRVAEIYDPASGTFQALPTPSAPAIPTTSGMAEVPSWPGRMFSGHATGTGATVLQLQDGRVWFQGGDYSQGEKLFDNSAHRMTELFTPSTGLFQSGAKVGGAFAGTFANYAAVALMEDGRVLYTGGLAYEGCSSNSAGSGVASKEIQLLDPVASTVTRMEMHVGRLGHSITKLADGRFLIAGGATGSAVASYGFDDLASNTFLDTATAEIFDPHTNTSTLVGNLNQARRFHAAVLLPTGQVLIAGGVHAIDASSPSEAKYVYPNYLELFDPDSGTFSVMDKLDYGLSEPQLLLLQDGNSFFAGQVQSPMDAPVKTPQSKGARVTLKAPRMETVTNGISYTSPSSDAWSGNLWIDQGTERVLNASNAWFEMTAKDTNPEAEANTHGVAHKPAHLRGVLRCSAGLTKNIARKMEVRLVLVDFKGNEVNSRAVPLIAAPMLFGWFRAVRHEFRFDALFTGDEVLPGYKIRMILDPSRISIPSCEAILNTSFDFDPKWVEGCKIQSVH